MTDPTTRRYALISPDNQTATWYDVEADAEAAGQAQYGAPKNGWRVAVWVGGESAPDSEKPPLCCTDGRCPHIFASTPADGVVAAAVEPSGDSGEFAGLVDALGPALMAAAMLGGADEVLNGEFRTARARVLAAYEAGRGSHG